VLVERKDLAGGAGEAGGDLGIERPSRALADEARGELHTPQQTLEGSLRQPARDLKGAHRRSPIGAAAAREEARRAPAAPDPNITGLKAHPEVGGQTQRRDQLGAANLLAAQRRLG